MACRVTGKTTVAVILASESLCSSLMRPSHCLAHSSEQETRSPLCHRPPSPRHASRRSQGLLEDDFVIEAEVVERQRTFIRLKFDENDEDIDLSRARHGVSTTASMT